MLVILTDKTLPCEHVYKMWVQWIKIMFSLPHSTPDALQSVPELSVAVSFSSFLIASEASCSSRKCRHNLWGIGVANLQHNSMQWLTYYISFSLTVHRHIIIQYINHHVYATLMSLEDWQIISLDLHLWWWAQHLLPRLPTPFDLISSCRTEL